MRRFVLLALLATLVALPTVAQVQYGSISGTVVDSDGHVLPGVTVTLAGPTMQGTRVAVTDTAGKFRFVPVPPGQDYTVTFELASFNTLELSGVGVNLARDSAVSAEMSLSEFAETITVTADRLVVDTTKSTVDTTVDWDLMDTIPGQRWFHDIMELAPGVRPGNNPNVNGGWSSGNVYMIDGVDTTDPRSQTWGTALIFDTIAELQLQTAAFQAEYGRATGGVLNLVTKSGGNDFSFTGRWIKSDADWSAKNGIDDETGRNKTGGSRTDEERPVLTFGGPIMKDALWFYLSYEERDNSRGFSWYETEADRNAGVLTEGRTEYAGHYFSGKLTWQATPSHNVVAFYNEDPIELRPLNRGWRGSTYNESTEQFQFQGGDNSSLQWTGVLSPSFFVEAKYQYHRQELNVEPDSPTWNVEPYIYNYSNGYRTGGPYYLYQSDRSRDGLILTGNYYLDAGSASHQIKGGLEYLGLKPETGYTFNPLGYYRRIGDTPYFYDQWTEQSGPTKKDQDYYALYVQDSWRFGHLTLNLGLRAEQNEIFNNKDKSIVKFSFSDMLAPRLGFAYDLNGDVIRGSIGRFYEMPSNYISDYFQETTTIFSRYFWNDTCAVDGRDMWTYGAECWDMAFSFPYGSAATLDPDLEPAYVDEITLGYEKRLSDQFAGGVTFIHRTQDQAIDWYDPDWTGYYYITNVPDQARKDGYDVPNKIMEYQALSFELRKRFGPDGFQFLANYTYAFKDNAWNDGDYRSSFGGWIFAAPEEMDKLWYGRTNSKQYFKVAGSYTFPWKTVVGINAYWDEGNLYTRQTYGDIANIPLERRGSSKVGNNWEADLYVEQPVKIGPVQIAAYLNVFNAFNNQQVDDRGAVIDNAASYTKPIGWQNPRQVQVGFKIEY